jgi:hypothetical protein
MSIPAERPAAVTTSPSSTNRTPPAYLDRLVDGIQVIQESVVARSWAAAQQARGGEDLGAGANACHQWHLAALLARLRR